MRTFFTYNAARSTRTWGVLFSLYYSKARRFILYPPYSGSRSLGVFHKVFLKSFSRKQALSFKKRRVQSEQLSLSRNRAWKSKTDIFRIVIGGSNCKSIQVLGTQSLLRSIPRNRALTVLTKNPQFFCTFFGTQLLSNPSVVANQTYYAVETLKEPYLFWMSIMNQVKINRFASTSLASWNFDSPQYVFYSSGWRVSTMWIDVSPYSASACFFRHSIELKMCVV